jgi:zinc ribbon protein
MIAPVFFIEKGASWSNLLELRGLPHRSWLQENAAVIGARRGLMFCPRCGQQCLTDVRFCSRCGLPLNVIAEVTANYGMAVWDPSANTLTPRQKGQRFGTILMLASLVLTPLFFGLSVLIDGPAPLLVPVTVFLTGLCFVLYSRTFGHDFPIPDRRPPYQVMNPVNNPMISPPQRSVEGLGSRKVNTADMAEPPSVTDHTTQFFD